MATDHYYESGEALASGLASDIAGWLGDALRERPRASLIVSGGSTPPPMLRALSDHELPWSRVSVSLSDERWVSPSDPASNAAMVDRELLRGPARAARFVSLYNGAADPEAGLAEVEAQVATLSWPLDVVVLGMGGDGHTASLFPDMDGLAAALDPANPFLTCPARPASQPTARLSLTLRALLDARRIVLLFRGEDKRRVCEDALAGDDAHALPVRAILHQERVPVAVYWSN